MQAFLKLKYNFSICQTHFYTSIKIWKILYVITGLTLKTYINCFLFFSLPFFFFSALVIYCTKSRRAERYWQKTLLQMEEMESQIREEIRKGVFIEGMHVDTHTRTHTHTSLSYCVVEVI